MCATSNDLCYGWQHAQPCQHHRRHRRDAEEHHEKAADAAHKRSAPAKTRDTFIIPKMCGCLLLLLCSLDHYPSCDTLSDFEVSLCDGARLQQPWMVILQQFFLTVSSCCVGQSGAGSGTCGSGHLWGTSGMLGQHRGLHRSGCAAQDSLCQIFEFKGEQPPVIPHRICHCS